MGSSRTDYEALDLFFMKKEVHLDSQNDKTFSFDDTEAAFNYLSSDKHIGKVVLKLEVQGTNLACRLPVREAKAAIRVFTA